MKTGHNLRRARGASGQSLVEFAIALPVLLVMVLGVADLGRAIEYNNILINMSREGANLASRSTDLEKQFIINALNHTSAPLVMAQHGVIYITKVKGFMDGNKLVARVEEQYRPTTGNGDLTLKSKLWNCTNWDAATGKCTLPAVLADRVVSLPLPNALALNAEVHVVEVIYDYIPITNYVMKVAPDLYSLTLL
ncbi:MAG: pilus assembly protein [Burkholderiales bacterium]|nr:pilus assembly protein [Burkholderiales bacterium]